jgi:hypothetical protein
VCADGGVTEDPVTEDRMALVEHKLTAIVLDYRTGIATATAPSIRGSDL